MKVIIQRVKSASCSVFENGEYKKVSEISKGYMLLVSFTHSDTKDNVIKMAKKIVDLRIFNDEDGKMNLNIKQVNGSILSISQFTLYADCKKGNRPSFTNAGNPELANQLYEYIITNLDQLVGKQTRRKQ